MDRTLTPCFFATAASRAPGMVVSTRTVAARSYSAGLITRVLFGVFLAVVDQEHQLDAVVTAHTRRSQPNHEDAVAAHDPLGALEVDVPLPVAPDASVEHGEVEGEQALRA